MGKNKTRGKPSAPPKTFEQKFSRTLEDATAELNLGPTPLQEAARVTLSDVRSGTFEEDELAAALPDMIGRFAVKKKKVLELVGSDQVTLATLANQRLLTQNVSAKILKWAETPPVTELSELCARPLTPDTLNVYRALPLTRTDRADLGCALTLLQAVQVTLAPEAEALKRIKELPMPAVDSARDLLPRGTSRLAAQKRPGV